MKFIWVKSWDWSKVNISVGVALNEWALPLSVCVWDGNCVVITVLCFYIGIDGSSGPPPVVIPEGGRLEKIR